MVLCDHKWKMGALTGLSLRPEAHGFPSDSMSMTSGYFHRKQTRKIEPKASTKRGGREGNRKNAAKATAIRWYNSILAICNYCKVQSKNTYC